MRQPFSSSGRGAWPIVVAIILTVISLSCSHVEKPTELIAAEKTLPETVDYNLHIKPILSDRCFACHGPDKAKQQAG
ncbi:hypothetical protein, partial [Nibrella saemangeumensis]|uniref:hypothetical protein n=1 Tax=Nibrella saemangeumensis TaxID=1084526 RepID=UPI0031EB888C